MKSIIKFPYFSQEFRPILDFSFKKCEKFYVVFPLSFPYSKNNPNYVDEELYNILASYQNEQYFSCDTAYSITVPPKNIINVYQCNKKTRQIINSYIEVCNANNEKPIDNIGFILHDSVWMNCIAHENENIIYNLSAEDEKQIKTTATSKFISVYTD